MTLEPVKMAIFSVFTPFQESAKKQTKCRDFHEKFGQEQ